MSKELLVFLDSNVLYSACHRAPNQFEQLWQISGVNVVTSPYCIGEVRRNLRLPHQRLLFRACEDRTTLVPDGSPDLLPTTLMLPQKDRPVLAAAIQCGADILLTGDFRHFGRFVDQTEIGIEVVLPNQFWKRFPSPSD